MIGAGPGNLTPTQIASHERSKAFRAKIAEAAARLADNVIVERLAAPLPREVQPPKPRELWFAMVDPIGDPLPDGARPTHHQIQHAVCSYFNMRRTDLLSRRRTLAVMVPRHIAAFIAKDLTLASFPEIGRRMGGRDHTTALNSVRRVAHSLPRDASLAFDVATITRSLIGDRPQ